MNRCVRHIVIAAASCLLLIALSGCSRDDAPARPAAPAPAPQPKDTEHTFSATNRVQLDGPSYWFYEGLGRITVQSTTQDGIDGGFEERQNTVYFHTSNVALNAPTARTEGYRRALDRVAAFLAPAALPDNAASNAYRADLKRRAEALIGHALGDANEFGQWWASNRDRLCWSEQTRTLATCGGAQ